MTKKQSKPAVPAKPIVEEAPPPVTELPLGEYVELLTRTLTPIEPPPVSDKPLLDAGVKPIGEYRGKSLVVFNEVQSPPPKTIEEYMQISRDIEGWFSEAEMQLLWDAAHATLNENDPDPIWAEVGSFKGKSTVILAAVLRLNNMGMLYAIDPHEGELSFPNKWGWGQMMDSDKLAQVGETFHEFWQNMEKAGVQDHVQVHRMQSTEFERPEGQLSLLFLDGLHDYESVKADWEHFKPMLKDGATVIFHDYFQWAGVTQLVDEAFAAGDFYTQGQPRRADSLIVFKYHKP